MSKMPNIPHSQHQYDVNQEQAKRKSHKQIQRWTSEGDAMERLRKNLLHDHRTTDGETSSTCTACHWKRKNL